MLETKMRIVDLSYHNGVVDFDAVKDSGVGGVIIRDGYGIENPAQKDKRFEEYYAKAKSAGLAVGAYHYSYAKTIDDSEAEARFMLKNCRGKSFELPLFFDIEDRIQQRLSRDTCTKMVDAFCGVIEAAGGWAGVYSYDTFFADKLEKRIPSRYTSWVARINGIFPRCVDSRLVGIWQYSFTGKIDGILTAVDEDNSYRDFPALIAAAGKNKF